MLLINGAYIKKYLDKHIIIEPIYFLFLPL